MDPESSSGQAPGSRSIARSPGDASLFRKTKSESCPCPSGTARASRACPGPDPEVHAAPKIHGYAAAKQCSLPLGRVGVGVVGVARAGCRAPIRERPTPYVPLSTPRIKTPPATSRPPAQGGAFVPLQRLARLQRVGQKLAAGCKQPAASAHHVPRTTNPPCSPSRRTCRTPDRSCAPAGPPGPSS